MSFPTEHSVILLSFHNAALQKVPKCRHTAAHQTQTKLNPFPFCTSQQSTGHLRCRLVYSPPLQKDERAPRGYLQRRKYSVYPCNNKRRATQYAPSPLFRIRRGPNCTQIVLSHSLMMHRCRPGLTSVPLLILQHIRIYIARGLQKL